MSSEDEKGMTNNTRREQLRDEDIQRMHTDIPRLIQENNTLRTELNRSLRTLATTGYMSVSGSIGSRYIPGTVDVEALPGNFEHLIKNEIRKREVDPISHLETLKEELERQLTAEKLLRHVLGAEEYMTFISKGEIRIKSKKYANRTYIIREVGKIDILENEKLVDRLCINPRDPNFPSQDELVTKKLGLEEAEELILRTANHFPITENGTIIEERRMNGETTREETIINRDVNREGTFWRRILRRQ